MSINHILKEEWTDVEELESALLSVRLTVWPLQTLELNLSFGQMRQSEEVRIRFKSSILY